MSWSITESRPWNRDKTVQHGPYYQLRIYVGKKDSTELKEKLTALAKEFFPNRELKRGLTKKGGLPEYSLYLGREAELPRQFATRLDSML